MTRKERIANGICTECREPAAPGIKTCLRHREKRRLSNLRNREAIRRHTKERRIRLKKAGKCIECAKFTTTSPHVLCLRCLAVHRTRAYNRSKAVNINRFTCCDKIQPEPTFRIERMMALVERKRSLLA